MTQENKYHWYDGLFYDKIIAPNQDKSYRIVKKMITKESTVLDVGCGTGRLEFQLADHCKKIDGIDLSIRNITTANNNLEKNNIHNVHFIHHDILKYLDEYKPEYDYAVLSYVIHEIDLDLREKLLRELSKAAGKIILIDYLHPRPKNLSGKMITLVEYMAGREHYSNFKTYMKNGGLEGLAKNSGLKITKEIRKKSSGIHIAVMSRI